MSRIRSALATLRRVPAAMGTALRSIWEWQSEIPDQGRVTLLGLVLLAAGGVAWCDWFGIPPLAAVSIPGLVLVAVGLGFTLRRGGTG
jgi:hypothetical protein